MKQHNFKIGQKVRFKTKEEFEREFKKDKDGDYITVEFYFSNKMHHLFGVTAEIKSIDGNNVSLKNIDTNGNKYWSYDTDMIVALEEDDEIKSGDLVGVSDDSQEEADEDFRNTANRYYIGKNKDGKFVCEKEDGYISIWKLISNKKPEEPKVEEMTLEQVCKELGRDIKIIK